MKILVIGDRGRDVFQYGDCKRICPEAPAPVFNPTRKTENPGMAANVGENLKSLGVEFVSLVSNLEEIVKTRYVDEKSNQLLLRVDENDKVSNSFKSDLINWRFYDAVVVADYSKGFLSVENLIEIAGLHPLTFLDTKKVLGKWSSGFSFIKINEPEYEHSKKWSDRFVEDNLIVTMSEKGAMYQGQIFPVEKTDVRDLSGAGDTFLAGLAVEYIRSKDIRKAIVFANESASQVVTKRGVVTI